MAFKRALWHSGLTYQQTCRQCHTVVSYTDHLLDFRPWYADGFVYCPTCRTPLRHSEEFAVDAPSPATAAPVPPASPYAVDTNTAPMNTASPVDEPMSAAPLAAFCTACGKQFRDDDRFCSGCGAKRT